MTLQKDMQKDKYENMMKVVQQKTNCLAYGAIGVCLAKYQNQFVIRKIVAIDDKIGKLYNEEYIESFLFE